jgi:CHAD domain-containing protein
MAKAREIPGLSADFAYGDVAARVIEVRCQELVDHSAGVLDTSDIERVHAMRVASRRLRAALEVFMPCFPRKQARTVLKDVKGLADALGERRDADVAIATLDAFAAAMPSPDRRGIESLADGFRDEQLAANADLAMPVEAARIDALQRSVHDLAMAARRAAGNGPERDAELDGGET